MIIQRRWLRSRIKELVLGTSIYRLRHEYVLNQTFSTNQTSSTERRTRDMVDLHADFLPTNDANAGNGLSIAWPSDPVERISVQQSIPKFLVELWTDQYGVEETESLCRVSNHPGPVTLRRNKIRCTSDDKLIRKLRSEEEVTAKKRRTVFLSHEKKTWKPPDGCLRVVSLPLNKSIWSLSSWKEGWFEVQDVGSQLIVKSVEAKPGDHIIDFCAGNGGKTLALASELHSTTNVSTTSATLLVAHDIMPDRLAQLRGSLDRAGLLQETSNVRVSTTSDVDDDIPDGLADAVLVDAPCSSCGVLRRRPSQRWMLTMHDICDAFPRLQLSILKRAARLVKPGGRLVYATCSVSEFENQNVLEEWEASTDYFFLNYRPWTFNDAEDWPPQYGMPAHCRQLLPHIHDSDGFFIARWRRAPIDSSN
jgi:16S rRNA (cytosine967-C5)-methyltransferase